ncbi:MAG: succinylglutamate desuccinylase/aspartoacylase family protein [Gammaproteobacteria bacterium]|uniref:M14 family metallopeptidase n=1 Tax=Rhodoferax sp. TaxID=50421 RepID=UPI00182B21E6|nr:M14 family metallopeptidase [Rhodoferax sp.]MBU3897941.1 succinylglutamate desuccinylase/aspartoacylase family protein [Gammaproteobacteria bacterium]MBA3056867.1 succinylglutamate desuccinylase/aspartoacylase family protein [Rhodoferax sp.]MBU3999310.1 succinylglutamate desuccinylase/aspartoacylase family protein [Gammaproteobacteria bacterium]MBU4018602.1 succinylglutamate desuccinylase/aspartoacylase family protein [Gammaproteobacteria bacterium]MBU4080837.1 succinylglutamate desuccinyla
MLRIDHPLLPGSLGSTRTLTSFHFGQPANGPKVYIQASLHAEELPGMLVAHHLRALLEAAEAASQILGEVILVPVANPLGLAQRVDHKPMGRFDLDTSENFNRHYPDLARAVGPLVRDALGDDPKKNVALVRSAIGSYLGGWLPGTELQSLRHRLLTLAHDADFVLDLHCDCEGVLHFYTEEACWPQLEPLARFLGSEAILLAKNSGSGPFDECLSGAWWRLSEIFSDLGRQLALPQGCCSTTIELRGELDVSHALAQQDAAAIVDWLQHIEMLACDQSPAVPAFKCQPTPLAGSETLRAPSPGLVVFAAEVGQSLHAGDLVAEVIDPIANQTQRVLAGVDGVFYARIRDRYITTGGELGKIAGATAFRTGELLGA